MLRTAFHKRSSTAATSTARALFDVELDKLEEAEDLWIRHVQKLVKAEDKYDQTRVSLGLFEDDKGVLRSGGRLQRMSPFNIKGDSLQFFPGSIM